MHDKKSHTVSDEVRIMTNINHNYEKLSQLYEIKSHLWDKVTLCEIKLQL